MPIAQIIEMPGAGVRDYEAAFAVIHPDGAWPEGQISHIAGPTPEGFRVIDVWESRETFERFERDVLAPLGFAGAPVVEFPVHNLVARGWRRSWSSRSTISSPAVGAGDDGDLS